MRTNVVGSKLMTRFCVASLLPILPRPVSSKVKYRWTGRDERSEAVRDFRFFCILHEYRTVYRSVRLPIACAFIHRDSPGSVDFFQRRYTLRVFRELFDSFVLEIARLFSDKK